MRSIEYRSHFWRKQNHDFPHLPSYQTMELFLTTANPWHILWWRQWKHNYLSTSKKDACTSVIKLNRVTVKNTLKMTSDSQPSKSFDHIYLQKLLFYTKSFIKILSTKGRSLSTLPGCVCQGKAPLQSDATVHEELAEQQWRVAGGVSRRATGGHPWGSTGRARHWLRFQLDRLRAAEWEWTSLHRASTEGLAHAAVQGFNKTWSVMQVSSAFLTGSPYCPSQSNSILQRIL